MKKISRAAPTEFPSAQEYVNEPGLISAGEPGPVPSEFVVVTRDNGPMRLSRQLADRMKEKLAKGERVTVPELNRVIQQHNLRAASKRLCAGEVLAYLDQEINALLGVNIQSQAGKPDRNLEEDSPTLFAPEVDRLFQYWKTTFGIVDTDMTPRQGSAIARALSWGYSEMQLKECFEGVKQSPFHMGENPKQRRFIGLTSILKSGERIEQHRARQEQGVQRDSTPEVQSSRVAEALLARRALINGGGGS